jgi:hypothetical protein
VNYEAWNRYVLGAIGVFGAILYSGLLYAGFTEFRSRFSKGQRNNQRNKKSARKRVTPCRLRNSKVSGR